MSDLLGFVLIVLKLWLQVIISPLFLMLVLVVAWQYRRMQNFSQRMFPTAKGMYLRATVVSALFGIAGGLVGSAGLLALGIDLARMGIVYLFMTAILLMLIHPRFLCFAYAGGIVSVSHLVFGWPDVSVPQLMGLVAVLHMVESVLIYLSGHMDPVPLYVETERFGVVGGFNLQKFWPIPLVAVVSAIEPPSGGSLIQMPQWWPLFQESSRTLSSATYVLLPVIAVLGYGEITTTAFPREKSRISARNLFGFSLALLAVSLAASYNPGLALFAALFGPLGHEMVIWLGVKAEKEATPIFVMPARGTMVLDVLRGSPAAQAGLKTGDVLLGINGVPVDTREELETLLRYYWGPLQVEVEREGRIFSVSLTKMPGQGIGVIPVPERTGTGLRGRHTPSLLDYLREHLRRRRT